MARKDVRNVSMNDSQTLSNCPFCGGEARHYAPGPIDHHIECVECYADIHRDTEVEAIAAWNTRHERTCRFTTYQVTPYFAGVERYPALIGVKVDGDEYETAYVCKSELIDALNRISDLEQLVRDTRNALYFMYNIRADKLAAKRMDDIDRRIAELGIDTEGGA